MKRILEEQFLYSYKGESFVCSTGYEYKFVDVVLDTWGNPQYWYALKDLKW